MKKTAKEIIKIVKSQHRRRQDFIEGNIATRIYAVSSYELKRIPLKYIDEDEWNIDESLVLEYAKLDIAKMPPIILHYQEGIYSIVDGIHRVNTMKALKKEYINAYVGIVPPDLDIDDIDDDDDDEHDGE